MDTDCMFIGCMYRDRSRAWIAVKYIESFCEVKGGSTIQMASGVSHDVLDAPHEIIKHILNIEALAKNGSA